MEYYLFFKSMIYATVLEGVDLKVKDSNRQFKIVPSKQISNSKYSVQNHTRKQENTLILKILNFIAKRHLDG